MLALAERLERLGEVDAPARIRLRDDHVGVLRARRRQRPRQVGRGGREADERGLDPGRLEALLLDLRAVVDPGDLDVDDRRRLRVQDVLAERAPRPEHRVVRPEEREVVLPLAVRRQQHHAAHDRLVSPQCGVERLVADRDRPELDDLDRSGVREALAALRAFLLRGGREAVADDERVSLDAAEVPVHVLDGGLDPVRPARPDQDLPALRVDRADHDRRQLRVRTNPLRADIDAVVGWACPVAPDREGHRDGERDPDDSGDDAEPHEPGFLSRPHARSSLLLAFWPPGNRPRTGPEERSWRAPAPLSSQQAHSRPPRVDDPRTVRARLSAPTTAR